MKGTQSQVELAMFIKERVGDDFDRVARTLYEAALGQSPADRADTNEIISILKEHRAAVMSVDEAGHFISTWQELNGRVRETIAADPRYQAIKARRDERKRKIQS